ncbi:MAG: hypothetical protein HY762_09470 [Planctomycetes bacterium]|nr:hypothetical protein [Planctomycetota bacterium]
MSHLSASEQTLQLIPQPRQITSNDTVCVLNEDWSILVESTATETERLVADLIAGDLLDMWGLKVNIQISDAAMTNRRKAIVLGVPSRDKQFQQRCVRKGIVINERFPAQGYILSVEPDEIVLLAADSAGVLYAAQTLRQLIRKEDNQVLVPGVSITDSPIYPVRGVQIDFSSGASPTVDYLKRFINNLSFYKLNLLMLSTPDNFSEDDIKELSKYAGPYQVELVYHTKLSAVDILDNYDKLERLYDKWVPLYNSRYIAVTLQGDLSEKSLDRLFYLLRPHLKEIILQSDDFIKYQGILDKLPKTTIIVNRGDKEFQKSQNNYQGRIAAFSKAGLRQFICPSAFAEDQIFPIMDYAFNDIQLLSREGFREWERFRGQSFQPVSGLILHLGQIDFIEMTWPLISYAADYGWYPDRSEEEVSTKRRKPYLYFDFYEGLFHQTFFGGGNDLSIIYSFAIYNKVLGFSSDMKTILYEDPFTSRVHLAVPDFFYWLNGIRKTMKLNSCEMGNKPPKKCHSESRHGVSGRRISSQTLIKCRFFTPLRSVQNDRGSVSQEFRMKEEVSTGIGYLRKEAKRNKEALDIYDYVSEQWHLLARKFLLADEIASLYRQVYLTRPYEPDSVLSDLNLINGWLVSGYYEVELLQAKYERLVKQRFKTTSESEIKCFSALKQVYRDKINRINKVIVAFVNTGKLAAPEELDFDIKGLPERLVKPSLMPPGPALDKKPTWWESEASRRDKEWNYRLLLKLENKVNRFPLTLPDGRKFGLPVEVNLNFTELLNEIRVTGEFDWNSVRVIEYNADGIPVAEIPYQMDKRSYYDAKYNADVNLVWFINDTLLADTIKYFYVYFDTLEHNPKPKPKYRSSDLTAWPDRDNNYWFKNDRMKVCISSANATITNWVVRNISASIFTKLDILEEKSGNRFFITPVRFSGEFNIKPDSNGHLMVRFNAVSDGGFTQRFTFYHHLPVCEIFINAGLKRYHNSIPGFLGQNFNYLLSNYQNGNLLEGNVIGTDTNWVALTKKDGLTVAWLTPDNRVNHYVDKGYIGATSDKEAISHFIIYADRLPELTAGQAGLKGDAFHTLNQLQSLFTLTDAPQISRSPAETKP